ncbi:hypothetical protein LCGC14_2814920 [marine sediment metagenome]|uniref:Uncharacterized protein n=1 Tax=marine sediment metagenome TaxID=412755 RepID=A0A0F8Z5K2_9ZZZZ
MTEHSSRVKAEVDRICKTAPLITLDQVKAAVEKAIAAERERCARLADDHPCVAEAIRDQT